MLEQLSHDLDLLQTFIQRKDNNIGLSLTQLEYILKKLNLKAYGQSDVIDLAVVFTQLTSLRESLNKQQLLSNQIKLEIHGYSKKEL